MQDDAVLKLEFFNAESDNTIISNFAGRNLRISNIEEYTLNENRLYGDMLKERWNWTESESNSFNAGISAIIEFAPLEIRVFRFTLDDNGSNVENKKHFKNAK